MSTLPVVEEILRETGVPMSVREIVERAGSRLPTKSKTPDTVVARDLSMDIKRKGEGSEFIRTAPGRYTMRAFVVGSQPAQEARPDVERTDNGEATPLPAAAVRSERAAPMAAHKPDSKTGDSFPVENR